MVKNALFAVLSIGLLWPIVSAAEPVTGLGSRLELFVDQHLVKSTQNIGFVLHRPARQPLADKPLPVRHGMVVIKDGDLYRAWYRGSDPAYKGEIYSMHPGRATFYAESRDGIDWTFPSLGLVEINGNLDNNAINKAVPQPVPFLDTRPGVPDSERFKGLGGYPGGGDKRKLRGEELVGKGLFAYTSADGIHWKKLTEVIPYQPGWRHAFDSANVSFWSEAEQQYVCYFRTWTPGDRLRSVARTTSPDFVNWSKPVEMKPNRPGEHLYTNHTAPYFRAPHIYLATPTRFVPGRGDSPAGDGKDDNTTDILFMSTRAGSTRYDRPFKGAFIRPGLDPKQWGNRDNYVAYNILPTGPAELSMYHRSGHRYTIRTDGFVSATADVQPGELVTRPVTFAGDQLLLNFSTSAAGQVQVELLDRRGRPIPGFTLDQCTPMIGDTIERAVVWTGGEELSSLAGATVHLRFVMTECDLFSYRFR